VTPHGYVTTWRCRALRAGRRGAVPVLPDEPDRTQTRGGRRAAQPV